jgi:glycine/D-amino acid oxidase-like deaminating enzyme
MPYVGEVETGLWAICFVGHGAMHGPPLAEVLAKAVVGRPDPVDISPWDLRRTPGPNTVWWRRKDKP